MKQKYSIKHLQTLQEHVEKARGDVRLLLKIHESDVRSLNTPEARKKFKPEHIVTQIAKSRDDAVQHLRHLGAALLKIVQPALAEKGLHAREHYLREAGFRDEVPDLADKNQQAMRQTLADLSAGIKQLSFTTRLARMPDEQLLATCEAAIRSGDVGLAGLALEESGLRKDSLLKLKVKALTDQIEVPEATAAQAFFDLTEDVLQEFADTERAIQEPGNLMASVGIRNRAINEARAIREAEEEAAEAKSKKEAAEAKAKEAKAGLDEFMQKAKDLPVEKPPVPIIELSEPPTRAA